MSTWLSLSLLDLGSIPRSIDANRSGTFPGFKYNMMDLQAAIGIHQLRRVEAGLKRRNQIWYSYNRAFRDLPVGLPAPDEPETVHARHLYTLTVDRARCGMTRDEFMQELHQRNIGTGVHYVGVHLHPYYRDRFKYVPEASARFLFPFHQSSQMRMFRMLSRP